MTSFIQAKNRSILQDIFKHKKANQMKKLYIPIVLFIAFGFNTMAQEKSRNEKQGDKYAFRYAYDKAIESYTDAKKLTTEGQRRLAESYKHMDQNMQAEAIYSQLVNAKIDVMPEDHYNYAAILKKNGKAEASHQEMEIFSRLKPDDQRAKSYMANKAGYANLLKDDGRFKTEHLNINTDAQDFGATYYTNKVVFASTRSHVKMVKRKYNWNGKPFLNLYMSDIDGVQLKKPESFNKGLNTKMHDGPASFSNNGTVMAFTTNNNDDKSKDKVVELQIGFSSYKDGSWSKSEPFSLNNSEYSVGQPCLSSDGNTMYFTSDKPGGFGGSDIYRSSKDQSGTWGKAENLGNKINTEGDEMFPFYEEMSGTLFFASDGHFGLGGLDLFTSQSKGSEFSIVTNAGSPLNTQYDDFAVIVDAKTNKGYFSSNRTGGSGDDDIYALDLLKGLETGKKINGFAKDQSGNVLSGAFVTLLNDKGTMSDTATTKADGAFYFKAEADKNYKLTGTKSKFIDGDSATNTFGKEQIVQADVILEEKKEPVITTIEVEVGKDLGKIVAFNPIYFDFHLYVIRPDAEIELKKIIKIMNEYPNMTVELGAHTDCRATAEYNQLLSNRRATASVEYIRKGITNPKRIYGKGYGETKLVNSCECETTDTSNCSEDEHQKNRRTEFIIIKK
jgi:outer membrane protein OmpA-like peptidoglycan-associated protein